MSEELTHEDLSWAVDQIVEEVLEAENISELPIDALALALHLGIDILPEEADEPHQGRNKLIVSRHEHTPEQLHWAAAHQIGRHLQGEILSRLGIEPGGRRPMLGASLPKQFADRLLVPSSWLRGEARCCGHDLFELKERFATASHEVIAWRLLDLDEPCMITIIDNDHVVRRRSNAYRVTKELSLVERNCQRQVQRYSRPCRIREDGWDVQGWPVHSADWQREILRSVVEE